MVADTNLKSGSDEGCNPVQSRKQVCSSVALWFYVRFYQWSIVTNFVKLLRNMVQGKLAFHCILLRVRGERHPFPRTCVA